MNNEKYVFFWGGVFSQWYKSNFTLDGITFNTAEQYMMYKKAMLFEDTEIVTDTPLSKLVKKIRMLQQLTIEDIEFVNMLDRDNILMLLLEYNCSVKFIDVAKFQVK